MAATRKKVRYFISYAHDDDEYAKPLIAHLETVLKPSRAYAFEGWSDGDILPGEHWDNEIRAALHACKLGVLLVSPAYLGSPYIDKTELPALIGSADKLVVPVMLRKVNLQRHDLKGLAQAQIFRLKTGSNAYNSYAQCGRKQREDFVFELHEGIEARLDKVMG